MQKPTSFAVIVCSMLLWGLASGASAQDDAQGTAAARALFEAGMQAVDNGDFATAVDRLDRSVQLRDSPVARVNLALALIELGRLVSATEHLQAAMRTAGAGSRVHDLAAVRLAEIAPRLGRIRIGVTGATESVELRLDDVPVPVALLGVDQPADPGPHTVSLHRDGGEALSSADVTVRSGSTTAVSLVAPEPTLQEVAAPLPAAPVDGGHGVEEEPWFWTLLAVLLVGAGVGITVGVLAANPSRDYVEGSSGGYFTALVEWP